GATIPIDKLIEDDLDARLKADPDWKLLKDGPDWKRVADDSKRIREDIEKKLKEGGKGIDWAMVGRLGFHRLVVEERDKREDLDAEIRTVRPLFINTAVESELIRKRNEAMQEQIVKLKA